jgi:hypothetical protein
MMQRCSKWVKALAFGALALGCASEEPVDLGDDNSVKTGEELSDFAAQWDGYVEAFSFTSGSERIQLLLDEEGQGSVIFGEGTPPEPPTDPNVGWPDSDSSSQHRFGDALYLRQIAEGFAFTVTGAEVTDKRLRFTYNQAEPYAAWCQLQTPQATGADDSEYRCRPNYGYQMSTDEEGNTACLLKVPDSDPVPRDCSWLSLCVSFACACDADGCFASDQSFVFDGALDDEGNAFVGTTTFLNERTTVRLTRQ